MLRWALAVAVLILAAVPAAAGPVGLLTGLLTGAAGFTGAITVAGGFFGTILGRVLVSVAVSALQMALAPRPKKPGIRTETTLSGEAQPLTFILGRHATGGYSVAPPMSHGSSRGRLTYVIDAGDLPGCALAGIIVNDEYVTIDWAATPHPDYGAPVTGRYAGFMWVKWRDGSQTSADAYLTGTYGSYPERPWTSDMILRGVPHAILTFRFRDKVWNGLPNVRLVVDGIPLYDPRADTTVGGSGPQRWADPSTWVQSLNPAVMIYNILRGIAFPSGDVWGGGVAAADLPLGNWFAAMNDCDAAVPLAAGGSEPAHRAGFEVSVADQPADVLEELLKAANAQIAEIGGVWKIRVGAPGLSAASLTDGDLVIDKAETFTPFPDPDATINAIHASYPEPVSLWEPKDAPPLYNSAWEAADGGRRLVADLSLPAVPYALQVQRLMRAMVQDERRFRRHAGTLPPRLMHLEPLDALAWTSARHGYSAKLFEAGEIAEDLTAFEGQVSLRERDPADYAWSTGDELAVTLVPAVEVIPPDLTVPSFAVAASTVSGGRRPAVRLSWNGTDVAGARGLAWELRPVGGGTVLTGTTQEIEGTGTVTLEISAGIVASFAYEARAILIADAPAAWTAWTAATTGAVLFETPDLADDAITRPKIEDLAVSDVWQAVELGPFTAPGALTTRATLALGLIGYGSLLRRGTVFEARAPANFTILIVRLDRRRKIAGVWDAWVTIWTVTIPANTSTWDQYSDGGSLSGAWDDFEYRVTTECAGSGNYNGTDVIRNIYVTVADVKK